VNYHLILPLFVGLVLVLNTGCDSGYEYRANGVSTNIKGVTLTQEPLNTFFGSNGVWIATRINQFPRLIRLNHRFSGCSRSVNHSFFWKRLVPNLCPVRAKFEFRHPLEQIGNVQAGSI